MKESGMDKLIELFKEYVDKYSNDTKVLDEGEYVVIDDGQSFLYGTREYSYLTLISKKFGFIKWLVDNDKINLNDSKLLDLSTELGCAVSSDIVIMVLSIQDNPIEFLISILKIS